MTDSIILPTHPEHCCSIVRGRKTIDVRKNKPKLKPPFKCYMYCTSARSIDQTYWVGPRYHYCDDHSHNMFDRIGNGAVIGEFVCDSIVSFSAYERIESKLTPETVAAIEGSLLSLSELFEYQATSPALYGWHISDVKLYAIPKYLEDFEIGDTHNIHNFRYTSCAF